MTLEAASGCLRRRRVISTNSDDGRPVPSVTGFIKFVLLTLKSTGQGIEGMLSSNREKSLGLRAVSQFFLYVYIGSIIYK